MDVLDEFKSRPGLRTEVRQDTYSWKLRRIGIYQSFKVQEDRSSSKISASFSCVWFDSAQLVFPPEQEPRMHTKQTKQRKFPCII